VSRDHFSPDPSTAPWDFVRSSHAPGECFADEIDIDFPSVAQLVDRVRDAFLNEPSDREMLNAEVQLSSWEASRGAVVPLEIPLRGLCRTCGGRGESWTEPCGACCGTGDALVHHPVTLSVPAGVVHGARFRFRINAPDAVPVRVEVRVAIKSQGLNFRI
jgi:hypothetical protein